MATSFADCFHSPSKLTSHSQSSSNAVPTQNHAITLQPIRTIESDLVTFVQRCDHLAATLHNVINTTEDLLQQHATTTRKTQQVHSKCHKLMTNKDKLDDVVRQIIEPLAYFDCLDQLCARVGLPPESVRFNGNDDDDGNNNGEMSFATDLERKTTVDLQAVAPDSPEIFNVLDQTSECLNYLKVHRSFRDSADYINGFLMVEKRALLLIKNDVFDKLQNETNKIIEHMEQIKQQNLHSTKDAAESAAATTTATTTTTTNSYMDGSEHLELLPPYTWWGNIGDLLRGQLGEITRRARSGKINDGNNTNNTNNDNDNGNDNENEHKTILHECQRYYFNQRMRLINDIVQTRLLNLSMNRSATELACLGCTLLAHVALLEAKLFGNFFTPELRDSNNRRTSSSSMHDTNDNNNNKSSNNRNNNSTSTSATKENTTIIGGPEQPMGGFKRSGTGRECGMLGVEEYMETKSIHVALGDREHWVN